ncbi:MAG TPA: hypothetical protein ENI87_03265, partial [bacterium]|nr:hypothetical protein [bacterium]
MTEALHRFRRRLVAAAFVRGTAFGLFAGLSLAAGLLLAVRLGHDVFPDWLAPVGTAGWVHWAAAAVAAVIIGVVAAVGAPRDAEHLLPHLERRLGTDGLLLAAADGAELDACYVRALATHLQRVPEVLPSIRWQPMLPRPLAAALVLWILHALPPVAPPSRPAEAAEVAVRELRHEVDRLATTPAVPPEVGAELRDAVRELAQRVAAGELDVWREIDELRQSLAREWALAGRAPEAAAGLAGELAQAAAEMARDGLLDQLPQGLQQALGEAARDAIGGVDLDALRGLLPEDPRDLLALAEAVARTAERMGLRADELGGAMEQFLAGAGEGTGEGGSEHAGEGGGGPAGGDGTPGAGRQGGEHVALRLIEQPDTGAAGR